MYLDLALTEFSHYLIIFVMCGLSNRCLSGEEEREEEVGETLEGEGETLEERVEVEVVVEERMVVEERVEVEGWGPRWLSRTGRSRRPWESPNITVRTNTWKRLSLQSL